MGLKYVEHIKSAVLILLIALSVSLTFSIWTYKPNYDPIEQSPTVEISIAEKMRVGEVIQPYKMITEFDNDHLTGTTRESDILPFMDFMKTWTFRNMEMTDQEVTDEELNEMVDHPGQVTLFFDAPIPFGVVDNLFKFGDSVTSEATFDRIVIDAETEAGGTMVHFIGKEGSGRYTASAGGVDRSRLLDLIEASRGFEHYSVVSRKGSRALYLPDEPSTAGNLIYSMVEVSPSRFKKALFSDPSAVKREQDGANSEKYSDNAAIMTVNTQMKFLDYIHPHVNAENQDVAIPSELILESLNFVNEHGGWTNDFKFASMDPIRKQIIYRMEIEGYPVFSEETSTEINQVWGDGQIFRYIRPYYQLDELLLESDRRMLPSGTAIAEQLRSRQEVDFSEVDEIVRGYNLRRDADNRLYILEPAWFYEESGKWQPVKDETGGAKGGLE